ncbi:MAG: MATE family efflux transporter [Albimonas sp.]|uniref:MATE family efflux transporter n=1 Tax=Albimonas sp. TaxID=1872425 RepID=UPI004057011D
MTLAAAPSPAQRRETARAARTRRLLSGPIAPTLARMAAPNVLAMGVTAAVSIAEAGFAGRLGVSALAGLAMVFPFVMLTQMLSGGAFGGAISAAVARALGAGDPRRAERLALHACVIALVAAAATAALMAVFGAPLVTLLAGARGAASEGAVTAALTYAAVFFPGCFAHWLCNALLSAVRGTGDMATPSLILLLSALGSIPAAGALSLGWGPFPEWGMAGLAAGQVVAYSIGSLAGLAVWASGRSGLSLRGAIAPLQGALFADILRVGLVASLSALQTVTTIVAMVGLVGRFGEPALAGYGLGARLEFLMVPVVFGIGAAMTAMVGACIGAGDRARALRVAWTGSLAAAVIVGGVGLVCALAPDLWLGLFLPAEAEASRAAGRAYFGLVGPFYGFFALGLALYFASQGAGRVLWPVLGGFARLFVAIGGGLLAVEVLDLGLRGVFGAVALGMLVYGLMTAAAIRMGAWGRP